MPEQPTAARYQGEKGKHYHVSKRTIPDCAYPWVARSRAEKLAPFVRSSDLVLEYGVGFGWNLARLACARKVGYDLSEFLAPAVTKAGIEFLTTLQGAEPNAYDVVVCHHMLEHAAQPMSILSEIKGLLKTGGKLLLFVPYEIERRYRHYDPGEPNHHLFSWNAQTLANLVAEGGFEVREAGVGRFGYDRFASVLAARLRLGETGYRLGHRLLHLLKPLHEVRVVAEKPPQSLGAV